MKFSALVVAAVVSVDGFSPNPMPKARHPTQLAMKDNKWLGPAAASLASLTLAGQIAGASMPVTFQKYYEVDSAAVLSEAPTTVAAAITETLDFSLPSYDDATKGGDMKKSIAPGFNPFGDFTPDFAFGGDKSTEDKADADAKKAEEEKAAADKKAAEAKKAAEEKKAAEAKKAAEEKKAAEAKKAAEEKAAAEKKAAEAKKAAEEKAAKAAEAEKKAAEAEKKAAEAEKKAAEAKKDDKDAPAEIKIPDVKIPDVKIPDVKMPDIKMPDVKMPDMPEMPKFSAKDMPEMPKFAAPDIPKFSAPDMPEMPKFAAPKFSMPDLPDKAPKVDDLKFDVPKISMPGASASTKDPAIGVEPQDVRDKRAKEKRLEYLEADKEAKAAEEVARQVRGAANEKLKIAREYKDIACETRPGGKLICLRNPFTVGY